MKKTVLIITALLFAYIGFAQPNRKPPKEQIEAQRIAFITRTLELTPTESQNFWPIYNDYEAEKKKLRQSKLNIKKNSPKTEVEANAFIENHFQQQEKLLALKRKYFDRFKNAIPPTKIVKLIRAERMFKKQLLNRLKGQKGRKKNKNRHR